MTSSQQRAELQRRIWQIANDVRGAVDGWDFKQYVLGSLFYRFISENFTDYITGGDTSVDYASMADTDENRGGSANPDIELSEISASMGDGNRLPRSRSNEKTPP